MNDIEDSQLMTASECANWYAERLKTFAMFCQTDIRNTKKVQEFMDMLEAVSHLFTVVSKEQL